VETPFQRELVRLISVHAGELPAASGRGLSAALGKSANHLWLILNRGMIPSGPAVRDLARVLKLTPAETDGLILAALATKGQTRSRDHFWIKETARIAAEKEAEIRSLRGFLARRGLLADYEREQPVPPPGTTPEA
jgi:hypothetical protein